MGYYCSLLPLHIKEPQQVNLLWLHIFLESRGSHRTEQIVIADRLSLLHLALIWCHQWLSWWTLIHSPERFLLHSLAALFHDSAYVRDWEKPVLLFSRLIIWICHFSGCIELMSSKRSKIFRYFISTVLKWEFWAIFCYTHNEDIRNLARGKNESKFLNVKRVRVKSVRSVGSNAIMTRSRRHVDGIKPLFVDSHKCDRRVLVLWRHSVFQKWTDLDRQLASST